MSSIRSFIFGLKRKFFDFYRDHCPERLCWWALILALSPYLLLRLWAKRVRGWHRSRPPHFLVIHFAGIGDTLMMTPALHILKQHFPEAKIDLALTHHRVKEAFEGHPFFHDIIRMEDFNKGYFSFQQATSKKRGVFKTLYYFPRLFLELALRDYDVAIVYALSLPMEHLGAALACAAGIPFRVGFGDNHQGFLHRSLRSNLEKEHRVEVYIKLLHSLGVSLPGEMDYRYVFPLSRKDRAWAGEYLKSSGILERPLMAMHPGEVKLVVPRRWPAEHFIEVARWFIETTEGSVLLTGGPDDREYCHQITSALGENVLNTCGQFSIRQTAAFLAHCDICLTNDTGMLHIAAAIGVPRIVVVFGPTNPELLIPKGSNIRYLQASLPCIPCAGSVISSATQKCSQPIEGECLHAIEPKHVILILREVLHEHRSRHGEVPAVL